VTSPPTPRPVTSPPTPHPGASCRGEWPDPGPLDLQDCNGKICLTEEDWTGFTDNWTVFLTKNSSVFLSDSLPGVGTYECRYEVSSTMSRERWCATIVPKYPDATVVALSRYRRLSPCHIQSSWIVSSTYDRTQYGYPYVRLNWDSSWQKNYTDGWGGNFPEALCRSAQNVKEFHSYLCFAYAFNCNLDFLSRDRFETALYAANGYKNDWRRFCRIVDYTICFRRPF
jgi:hypothetical protein